MPKLRHGQETAVYGDQVFWKEEGRRARAQTMFALANLGALRHPLLPPPARGDP